MPLCANHLVFHLILCSLPFPSLMHSDILVCFPSQQHTIHVVVSCIFHNLSRLPLCSSAALSPYPHSSLIWYWVSSRITWMPLRVNDTEMHTVGVFLLIRGKEDMPWWRLDFCEYLNHLDLTGFLHQTGANLHRCGKTCLKFNFKVFFKKNFLTII